MYYVFHISKEELIYTALENRQGAGAWDFKFHKKFESNSVIPNSHENSTPLRKTRDVFVLETQFAPEDSSIQASAETESEYYTNSHTDLHTFLALSDTQTIGKTKSEIDNLINA